jgi:ubiquinol-cytochrome c reductase cytochrome b subunit
MVIVGPALAFVITRRICLGLQRKDAGLLTHGVETGIIHQLPSGEFVEEHRPLTDEERAPLEAKQVPDLMPAPESHDGNGVPVPETSGPAGRARAIANRAFAETIPLQPNGHGPGNGNGSGNGSLRRGLGGEGGTGGAGRHVGRAVGEGDDAGRHDGQPG